MARWDLGSLEPSLARRNSDRVGLETTAPDVPIGFDALHYYFHKALRAGRASPGGALVDALEATSPTLSRLGVDDQQHGGLACLYALEMQLRFTSGDVGITAPRWLDGLVEAILERYAGA